MNQSKNEPVKDLGGAVDTCPTSGRPKRKSITPYKPVPAHLRKGLSSIDQAFHDFCDNELAPRDEKIQELSDQVSRIAAALEDIVCTEGIDMGVILKDSQGVTKYDSKLNCHVYQHKHFSELGDALIALWKITQENK